MIGKLQGNIAEIHGNEAFVQTSSGVFYKVFVTPGLTQKASDNTKVEMYTYLNVREDELTLFGFETFDEYRLFTYLIAVDKVGPKSAFTILSTTQPSAIRTAVHESDVSFFQQIKGIGKKTAQRILIDLSSAFGAEFDLAASQDQPIDRDAVDALVSLGFRRKDAIETLKDIDDSLPLEDKIRTALQSISRG